MEIYQSVVIVSLIFIFVSGLLRHKKSISKAGARFFNVITVAAFLASIASAGIVFYAVFTALAVDESIKAFATAFFVGILGIMAYAVAFMLAWFLGQFIYIMTHNSKKP